MVCKGSSQLVIISVSVSRKQLQVAKGVDSRIKNDGSLIVMSLVFSFLLDHSSPSDLLVQPN